MAGTPSGSRPARIDARAGVSSRPFCRNQLPRTTIANHPRPTSLGDPEMASGRPRQEFGILFIDRAEAVDRPVAGSVASVTARDRARILVGRRDFSGHLGDCICLRFRPVGAVGEWALAIGDGWETAGTHPPAWPARFRFEEAAEGSSRFLAYSGGGAPLGRGGWKLWNRRLHRSWKSANAVWRSSSE